MTTCYITLWEGTKRHDDMHDVMMKSVTSDNNAFFIEIMSTLKAIKNPFERSYDKQIFTFISYEIYQTRQRLV